MTDTIVRPSWEDIRSLIERAKDDAALKEIFARALDKWVDDCWGERRATSDDFPTYLLDEYRKDHQ